MAERCAVVGIGQTKHAKVRHDLSMAGLVREAAERALADAGMDWPDIDSVVIGKAPDTFEANSRLPRMSSSTMLPATRALKRSPIPWSNTISAGTRESTHETTLASGYCAASVALTCWR